MRRVTVLLMSIGLMVTAIAGPSQAVAAKTKVTKPSAPTIISVTSSKLKSGKVNVTVKIALPMSNGGSKITGSKVSFAGKSCTMKNKKTSCTIKGINGGEPLKIVAISKNKKGFGAKSKTTRYTAGTAQLRFNLRNAVGIALSTPARTFTDGRSAVSTSPQLLVTNAAGTISNGVSSGSATISKFLIAPNGNLFVLFQYLTDVNGVGCLLAEVAKATGIPVCIDGSLERINWTQNQRHKPIQFDASGAIYYMGNTYSGTSLKTVLRKYQNGRTTDLINDFIELRYFAALPTGGVLITGNSTATGATWTRQVNNSGGIKTLLADLAQSMDQYADGNIYIGKSDWPNIGLLQFNVQNNALSDSFWIGNDENTSPVINNISSICYDGSGSGRYKYSFFCGSNGAESMSVHNTVGGKTFTVSHSGSDGVLAEVFPSVNVRTISVKRIAAATTLGSGIAITGLDATDKNKTIYFNADSGNETTLIPNSNEIEVYHMTYNAATNKMMFDGLRFADNKYVFGQVDLGTNQLNIFSTLPAKWDDFQGFQ